MHWRRKWQPTPVFLPGESQGRGSLVGCRLWSRRVGHDWSDLAAAAAALENHAEEDCSVGLLCIANSYSRIKTQSAWWAKDKLFSKQLRESADSSGVSWSYFISFYPTRSCVGSQSGTWSGRAKRDQRNRQIILWNEVFPALSVNKDVIAISDLGPPNVNFWAWRAPKRETILVIQQL